MSAIDRERLAAVRTLQRLGYTYHGGEQWKPPLGGGWPWTPSMLIAVLIRRLGAGAVKVTMEEMQSFGTPLPTKLTFDAAHPDDIVVSIADGK